MSEERRQPDPVAALRALLPDLGVDPATVDRSHIETRRTGSAYLRVTYLDGRQQGWEQEPGGPWTPIRENPFRVSWTA